MTWFQGLGVVLYAGLSAPLPAHMQAARQLPAAALLGNLTPHPWLLALALVCSIGPAVLFVANLKLYQPPPPPRSPLRPISALIPARNEAASIAAAVGSVLASTGVELEVIVLDDASTDATAPIVEALAGQHASLRLAHAPALPSGWNGKQHACHALAGLATHDVLCFLDADVRLDPEALARLQQFLDDSGASLVSGFPREETGTWLEWLLIPLIHFVLLGFLPFGKLRKESHNPAFAAGCGQIMMVDRAAYRASGGHAAIRESMHDGLRLPRSFREHGFATDLADLTMLARCRMYTDARGVWQGLVKNATEGMAAPGRIVPFTLVLGAGQILPLVLMLLWPGPWTLLALLAAYAPRVLAARRFRQSWRGALLHPVGIAVLLVLQWYALGRKLLGYRTVWKERACDVV
jgi:hypothetical protein